MPLLTFLPVFTRNIFHGDVGLYSRLMACSGVGAIAGALVVAWLGRFRHMGITAMLLQMLAGALILGFTLTHSVTVAYVLLLVIGAAIMIAYSLYTSLTQLIVPNELRGRVMSVYMLAFRGGMPLGSLVTGFLVDQVGAPAIAGNGVCSARSIWFLFAHRTRRVLVACPGRMRCGFRSAAPGWQDARSEHIGNIRATSNAARRDAPPERRVAYDQDRP